MLKCSSNKGLRLKWKTISLCVLWYTVSSIGSIVNKVFLQTYPLPLTLAFCNLLCVPFFAYPFLQYWRIETVVLKNREYNQMLVPLSIGKALAVGSAYFSLSKVPVSYSQAVKASMPLFAVALSRLILREKQSNAVYLSLVPIVAGVVIASITEVSFSVSGLLSALCSTFTYSLLSIIIKKLLKNSGIHPLRLLALNSQMSAVFFLPFWFVNDGISLLFNSEVLSSDSSVVSMYMLLLCSATLSFLQNVCAFELIHELTALSYSVCNATKRVSVIIASLLTMHNPVTGMNIFGIFLSVIGVFCYNRAKHLEHASHLPHINQEKNYNSLGH